MNGEEFYEEFKAALDYLGVGFHGKADVQLGSGSVVHLSVNGRECSIRSEPHSTVEGEK